MRIRKDSEKHSLPYVSQECISEHDGRGDYHCQLAITVHIYTTLPEVSGFSPRFVKNS